MLNTIFVNLQISCDETAILSKSTSSICSMIGAKKLQGGQHFFSRYAWNYCPPLTKILYTRLPYPLSMNILGLSRFFIILIYPGTLAISFNINLPILLFNLFFNFKLLRHRVLHSGYYSFYYASLRFYREKISFSNDLKVALKLNKEFFFFFFFA